MEREPLYLGDISNQESKQSLAPANLKTFTRQRRANAVPPKDSLELRFAEEMVESQDSLLEEPLSAGKLVRTKFRAKPEGYNRKIAPPAVQQEEVKHKAYIARLRAHFAEVDAFELQVESPEPQQANALPAAYIAPSSGRNPGGNGLSSPVMLPRGMGEVDPTSFSEDKGSYLNMPHSAASERLVQVSKADNQSRAAFGMAVSSAEENDSSGECRRPDDSESSAETDPLDRLSPKIPSDSAQECKSARKAPAFGLSRRSSICFASSAVTPREPAACSHQGPADPGTMESPRGDAQPKASLLSRLSMGLTGTLHRLGIVRKENEIHEDARNHSDVTATIGSAESPPDGIQRQEFSPIAESPEAGEESPQAPNVESPITPVPRRRLSTVIPDTPSSAVASITAALQRGLHLETPPPSERTTAMQQPAHVDKRVDPELSFLQQLLQVCEQAVDERSIPSMEELLMRHIDLAHVRKIGEGTFGEAFKGGDLVLKIVPLEGSTIVNGETQKQAVEILAEVAITLTLSQLRSSSPQNATAGFVETHGVGICRGRYAPQLLAEWHSWDEEHTSENDAVDCFPESQLYVVFVVADGGLDLEHFDPRSFGEAKSIVLQCVMALAVAEEACEFEHRDLHWGNVLVRRQPLQNAQYKLRGVDISLATGGVLVTLIDFTLSRLKTLTGEVAFCDLGHDPELFQGPKGDCQAETYRRMKKASKGNWQLHTPATNTLWIHYLADLLLNQKKLACSMPQKRELRNFRKRALSYQCCADMIMDEFFCGMWHTEG